MSDSFHLLALASLPVLGVFGRLFEGQTPRVGPPEVLRLRVHMSRAPGSAPGSACLEWEKLQEDDESLRCFLVTLLCARILISHERSRSDLMEVVNRYCLETLQCNGESRVVFPDWTMGPNPEPFGDRIWPWVLAKEPRQLKGAKTYVASLCEFTRGPLEGYHGINLNMAWGQEDVLAPSSALLAISTFFDSLPAVYRTISAILMARTCHYVQETYSMKIGSEPFALRDAIIAGRSGRKGR